MPSSPTSSNTNDQDNKNSDKKTYKYWDNDRNGTDNLTSDERIIQFLLSDTRYLDVLRTVRGPGRTRVVENMKKKIKSSHTPNKSWQKNVMTFS